MSRLSLRHLFSRLAKRPATRRTCLGLDLLEERRTPVTAGYNIISGNLDVAGTGSGINDRIFLLQSGTKLSVYDGRSGNLVVVPIDIGGNFFGNIDVNSIQGITVN